MESNNSLFNHTLFDVHGTKMGYKNFGMQKTFFLNKGTVQGNPYIINSKIIRDSLEDPQELETSFRQACE